MTHLFSSDTMTYTISANNSYLMKNKNSQLMTKNYPNTNNSNIITNEKNNVPQIYRKVYSSIKCKYCQLIKKKIIYANPTKTTKLIKVTSLNFNNLKVKKYQLEIKPYSNGEIQLRMYFDHTMKKNEEVALQINDGKVIEQLVFSVMLVE